jgi:hypothetical protein
MADKRGGLLTTKFPSRGAFTPVERMPDWMRTGERWREQGITSDPDQRRQVLDWDAAQAGVQRQGRLYRGGTLPDRVEALQEGLLGAAGQVPGVPWVAEKLGSALGSEAGRNVTQFLDSIPPGVDMGVGKGMLAGAGLAAKVSGKAKAAGKAVRAAGAASSASGAVAGAGKRAASNIKSDAILNIRALDPDEAKRLVLKGAHLKQDASGQYIGAPRGIDSPAKLAAWRRGLDRQLEEAARVVPEAVDWYDRARGSVTTMAGPDPARQYETTRNLALYSAQRAPKVNLGLSLAAEDAYAMGKRADVKGAGNADQWANYVQGRKPGSGIKLGNKTVEYGNKFDPTFKTYDLSPTRGLGQKAVDGARSERSKKMGGSTNDIWHFRFLGYTGPGGSTFKSGGTPQMHAFADAETLLAAERASQRGLGGRSDWNMSSVQALPWVYKKGGDLYRRGYAESLEDGYRQASQEYREHFPSYFAHATNESMVAPGVGHLENLKNLPDDDKRFYHQLKRSIWANDDGQGGWRSWFFDANHKSQLPGQEARGYYKPDSGGPEMNAVDVYTPLVSMTPQSATSFVDPKTGKAMLDTDRGLTDDARNLMQGGANLVGYAQVQNAGAWSAPINAAKQRNKGGLLFETGRALTPSEMAKVAAAGKRVKLPDVVDYGDRVLFNRFWSGRTKSAANAKNRKEATPKLRAVMDKLGFSEETPVRVDSGLEDYQKAWAKANEGQGVATGQFLRRAGETNTRDVLNTQELADRMGGERLVDSMFAAAGAGRTRPDIQNARGIMAGSARPMDELQGAYDLNQSIQAQGRASGMTQDQINASLKKAGVWLPALGLLGAGLGRQQQERQEPRGFFSYY